LKEKKCTKCESVYPETYEYFYYQNKSKKELGFMSQCKKCMIKYSGKYQNEHFEQAQEFKAGWHQKNKEYKLKRNKQWILEHPEERKQYLKEYYYQNKDKFKAYRIKRKMHKKHEISLIEWNSCKKYFDNLCAYCGKTLDENGKDFCKDHIDNDGSNDLTNCIPACAHCNCTKSYKEFDDFYNEDNSDFSFERWNKIQQWISKDCYKYLDRRKQNGFERYSNNSK
jgi:hypothetical protein